MRIINFLDLYDQLIELIEYGFVDSKTAMETRIQMDRLWEDFNKDERKLIENILDRLSKLREQIVGLS